MEEDFEDDLEEEGLPTGHDAVAPGKGILLLPHRQLNPHSQLLKVRPSVEQESRSAVGAHLHSHTTHSHLSGQDHGDWTYEEQFRQVPSLSGPLLCGGLHRQLEVKVGFGRWGNPKVRCVCVGRNSYVVHYIMPCYICHCGLHFSPAWGAK